MVPAEPPTTVLPRFDVGPFTTAPRRTLTTHANTAISSLYAIANELAACAESLTDPIARGRMLAMYGQHVTNVTRLAVGNTMHVNLKVGGQESLPAYESYPAELRERFEALAEAAGAAGVDVAGVLGIAPRE